jgi:hypothetical protein
MTTTLYTHTARARAAARSLSTLRDWAALAERRLVQLALQGNAHSPAGAWLLDLLGRLGAAMRRIGAWVEAAR